MGAAGENLEIRSHHDLIELGDRACAMEERPQGAKRV